jgi:hypothetical protein
MLPCFRFGQEHKTTGLRKTNEPGPGSYFIPPTVGIIAGFNQYENHPFEGSLKEVNAKE